MKGCFFLDSRCVTVGTLIFWPNRRTRRVWRVRCNAATSRAKFSYGEVKKLLGDPVMLVVAKT